MTPLVRYGVVRLCLDVQFWFPVWLVFLLHQGFSLGEAALADGLFRIVVVLLEIPLGAVGDRIGRRASLLIVVALTAVVFAVIGVVSSLPSLILVWAAWGVLWALASGLDTAYAWELAQQVGTPPAAYLGRIRSITGAAGFLSLLTAGWLYERAPSYPFWVTTGLAVVALPIVLTLPDIAEEGRVAHAIGEKGIPALLSDGAVRWRILLGALVLLAGWTVQIVFQPLAVDVGVAPAVTGLVYGAFAVARGLGGWWGSSLVDPTRPWVPVGVATIGVGCIGVWVAVTTGLPALALWILLPCIGVAHAAVTTVTDVWVSEVVTPRVRATALSITSSFAGVVMVGARPGLAVASARVGAAAAFAVWGIGCLALTLVAIPLWRRARSAVPAHLIQRDSGGDAGIE